MLQTRFCERFGVAAPIVVAPMGPDLTGPELVAAVCNAGGFGILQAQFCPPPLLRAQITYLRTLTDKPFGVNFLLHFPHRDGIEVCLEERVAALSFFWGDPSEFVTPAHAAGLAVIHQVGSVEAAVDRAAQVLTSSSLRALRPAVTWRVPFPRWRWCLASSMRWPPHWSWPPAGSLMHGGCWQPSAWAQTQL